MNEANFPPPRAPLHVAVFVPEPDAVFLRHVVAELKRARAKFPENKHQLAAFSEEAGELAQALLQCNYGGKTHAAVWCEAVQACAMAVRVGTEGDHTFNYNPDLRVLALGWNEQEGRVIK